MRKWADRSSRNVDWIFLRFYRRLNLQKTIHFKKLRPQAKLTLITQVPVMTLLAMLPWFSIS